MNDSLAPGAMFGPYRIESVLGSGGMGAVFRAIDTRLDRQVALKVVRSELAAEPEFRSRFRAEAAILARVDSPHIVSIHEYGEHEGSAFIAAQLVPGGDLGALLRARGPMAPRGAAIVVAQVAEALEDAHRVGVIHRDIKPGNVLIRDPDAEIPFAYLCDFGIAQPGEHSDGQTVTGTVVGSWAYISPERLSGAPASPASDIYALGCLLYACLTGSAPYTGTDAQVASAHLNQPPPQVPATSWEHHRLNGVIARAMAKDPRQRFGSASQMRAVLLESGQGVQPLTQQGMTRPGMVPDEVTRAAAVPMGWSGGAGPSPMPGHPRSPLAVAALVSLLVLFVGGIIGGAVWAFRGDSDKQSSAGNRSDGQEGGPSPADEKVSTPRAANAPTNASEMDFCLAWQRISRAASEDELLAAVDELEETGTPEGVSAAARSGFVFLIEHADDDELVFEEIDKDDQENISEFFTYAMETCDEVPGGLETPVTPSGGSEVAAFCEAVVAAGDAEGQFAATGEGLEEAQAAWEELYAVGAPDDITPTAMEGFTWYYELLTGVSSAEELGEAYGEAQQGGEEMQKFAEFQQYIATTCVTYDG